MPKAKREQTTSAADLGAISGIPDSLACDMDNAGFPRKLIAESKQKEFLPKDIIYHESDQVDVIHVIRSGMVKLISYQPNGRARIVRLHASGHWIALEGLIGQRHEHTAVAVDDVSTIAIPASSIQQLEHDHPRDFLRILRIVYAHLTQADMWIANFSTGSIKPRVARLVEFLAKLEYGDSSDIVELLTVYEMAEILGVTPESVSRVLAEFKRKDILQKRGEYTEELYQVDEQRLLEEAIQ